MAYERYRRSACSGCGTRESEWHSDRFAFVGQLRYCLGCEVLEQEKRNIPEGKDRQIHPYLVPRQYAKDPDERVFDAKPPPRPGVSLADPAAAPSLAHPLQASGFRLT